MRELPATSRRTRCELPRERGSKQRRRGRDHVLLASTGPVLRPGRGGRSAPVSGVSVEEAIGRRPHREVRPRDERQFPLDVGIRFPASQTAAFGAFPRPVGLHATVQSQGGTPGALVIPTAPSSRLTRFVPRTKSALWFARCRGRFRPLFSFARCPLPNSSGGFSPGCGTSRRGPGSPTQCP